MKKTIESAEILSVGTELLLGDIVNTNAAFIARSLAENGVFVYRHTAIGDNEQRIIAALDEAYSRCDTVILTGGLGPTCDDITKETVAKYLGLEMRLDETSLARIRRYFADIGKPMPNNNVKQAYVPVGATVFENEWGTAPAMAVEADGKTAILLPGPPVELVPLWRRYVIPYLHERTGRIIVSKNVHVLNMGESRVEEILRELMSSSKNPTVAPYAKDGEVRVRVSAYAATASEAGELCDKTVKTITATEVGAYVYGIDVESAENALISALRARKMTLAVAESCTGGLLAKRITDVPGCSDVFLGGVVSYANEIKMRLLGVKSETLDEFSAVSEQTAVEMARGVRAATGASIGLSTTGIAGPSGGTAQKPVGTVFVAVSSDKGEKVKKLSMSPLRSRDYIRYSSATQALGLALEEIGAFGIL